MSDTTVARRYAQALYEEAEAAARVDAVDAGVDATRETLKGSRELARLFASPIVSSDKKEAVVASLFDGQVDPLVVRLMQLLVSKGREALLETVLDAYRSLRDERLGLTEAHVRTALPLDPNEADALKAALARVTGRKVRLRIEVEPDLIGGLVVRIGDTVYNGSARHQLEQLREQFANRVYLSN